MHSSSARFELSATIGQPNTGVMTSAAFEMTGGFWFGLVPGDGNEDGIVSLSDHELFESCMNGPEKTALPPECAIFDRNHDGAISLDDYAMLQANFSGD